MSLKPLIITIGALIFSEMCFADLYYSCSTEHKKLANIRIYGYIGQFTFSGPHTSHRSVEIDKSFKSNSHNLLEEVYAADENVLIDVRRYSKNYRLVWSLNGSVKIDNINFDCLSFSGSSTQYIGYFETGDENNREIPFILAVLKKELQPLSEEDQKEFKLAREQRRRSACFIPRIEIWGQNHEAVLSELETTRLVTYLGPYTINRLEEKSMYSFSKEFTMGDLEDNRIFEMFSDFIYSPNFPRDTYATFESEKCK